MDVWICGFVDSLTDGVVDVCNDGVVELWMYVVIEWLICKIVDL